MTEQWFGTPWPDPKYRASVCADDECRVPVPVGQHCSWCDEAVVDGDQGVMTAHVTVGGVEVRPVHIECRLRQVLGGPGHLNGKCICAGGDHDPDMGMSARDAARYVARWVEEHGR